MKILVISDTHGNLRNAIEVIKYTGDINRIIHLGDYERDVEELEIISNVPIDFVPGNCDFSSYAPSEKILNFYDLKILITHGHYYNVKWEYNTILKAAKQKKVDIVLFGHTHVSLVENIDNITIINPGSISLPRDGKGCSFCILEIEENGKFHITIKKLEKKQKNY
ncbi:metallophosphoesterase family protein [Vallitalea sp.]|jgi:putative phosphoesterase|uniref:metallophosphoesterase family protein n=1 Tax=Vallitalea sp. TaxID=1882829 RepID=UPI0025D3D22C|nr:metallophosphoesterase [Vallitalea sp.]MCT4685866.1 metallophosphoesterase [Vallitalea sp.]